MICSQELVKHCVTKTLVGSKVLLIFSVVAVMWIVLLTYLPEYKAYLID